MLSEVNLLYLKSTFFYISNEFKDDGDNDSIFSEEIQEKTS